MGRVDGDGGLGRRIVNTAAVPEIKCIDTASVTHIHCRGADRSGSDRLATAATFLAPPLRRSEMVTAWTHGQRHHTGRKRVVGVAAKAADESSAPVSCDGAFGCRSRSQPIITDRLGQNTNHD